jgi:hypothetical protein
MITTVIQHAQKRPRNSTEAPPPDGSEVIWPVKDLPSQDQCGKWLNDVITGTDHEGTAISIWTHHPNLRESTEKLASFITPMWPTSDGGSLLQLSVENAVGRAQEAIEKGQAFEGRLIGVYLYGLVSVVTQVARLVIRGVDRNGQTVRWNYFSEPLLQWAGRHGIEQLVVKQATEPASEVVLSGLRTHMIACLASPVDAGYLEKHASYG